MVRHTEEQSLVGLQRSWQEGLRQGRRTTPDSACDTSDEGDVAVVAVPSVLILETETSPKVSEENTVPPESLAVKADASVDFVMTSVETTTLPARMLVILTYALDTLAAVATAAM